METLYQKYAKLLLHYSLQLKKGDKLLIMSSYLAEDLLKEVYRESLAIGAYPEFNISINGTEKIFYDTAGDDQLKYVSPTIKYALENYEAFLMIRAPFNLKELENVDPAKKQTVSLGRAYINKTIFKRVR